MDPPRSRMVVRSFVLALLLAGCAFRSSGPSTEAYRTWRTYGGDPGQTRYSALDQIDRTNVHRLELAWTFDSGDDGPTIQTNPLIVGDVMYLLSPMLDVVAVDAATGRELWRFEPLGPDYDGPQYWRYVSRGVTYWAGDDGGRVFSAAGPYLWTLDAATGKPIASFGSGGRIDLRRDLDRDPERVEVLATSPGVIFDDLIIVGANVSEKPHAAPGYVRAYDVRTGALAWTFRTIPAPGEFGNETWENGSWRGAGGVNPWSGMSLDADRGILYAPTGAPTYDFYGGNRAGANLFANTVVALDARTGERLWHYQVIRHDIWDYDLPAPPSLITIEREGRRTDAVAQITKTGFVFILNRVTGEPLFPVEERAVPASDVPDESAWPTQRFPILPPPFARQGIHVEDLTERTPAAAAQARAQFDSLRSEGLFTPGSERGTLMLPGLLGGGNWSGAAVDPSNGRLYVSANNFPSILRLHPAPDSLKNRPGEPLYRAEIDHFVDAEGYPAIKPPWGTLTAIDLNAGEIVWQVPLGTYPELAARGLRGTGTLNLGGPIVTAGGLVFIAATLDSKFRAFDADTGEVLWETELPTAGLALPATYDVNGKQYVVIAAGGGAGMRGERPHETPTGRFYQVYSLPEDAEEGGRRVR